jgi:hypothetical protein
MQLTLLARDVLAGLKKPSTFYFALFDDAMRTGHESR